MKKILIIIISTILICLIGLGTIGYFIEKDKAKIEEENKPTQKVEDTSEEDSVVIDGTSLDINSIEGYTPGEKVVDSNKEQEAEDDSTNNEENDDINNNSDKINGTSNATTVGGIELPFKLPNKNMEILSIGEYSGKFIEDGSDEKKENILALVVKNTSDEVIDYGEISLKIKGKSNKIKFKITNLKPQTATVVMESTGQVQFNPDDKYTYSSSKNDMVSSMSLMEDKVKVSTKDKEITIENISDEDLKTVYIYYKTVSKGNSYIGGITYRVKFENVGPGKSISAETLHFSNKKSEILKIESVEE
ncbi:hypothetical protein [Terrisporobacter sp.]|uniref:hypothetical protein n=1 Tax=Terrisporobacter sp. TaxID=1965305 RepID=UPI00260199B9|nr:hypothetical protein [Terrisporobacter sp.]